MVRNGVTEMTLGRLKKYRRNKTGDTSRRRIMPLFSLACPSSFFLCVWELPLCDSSYRRYLASTVGPKDLEAPLLLYSIDEGATIWAGHASELSPMPLIVLYSSTWTYLLRIWIQLFRPCRTILISPASTSTSAPLVCSMNY